MRKCNTLGRVETAAEFRESWEASDRWEAEQKKRREEWLERRTAYLNWDFKKIGYEYLPRRCKDWYVGHLYALSIGTPKVILREWSEGSFTGENMLFSLICPLGTVVFTSPIIVPTVLLVKYLYNSFLLKVINEVKELNRGPEIKDNSLNSEGRINKHLILGSYSLLVLLMIGYLIKREYVAPSVGGVKQNNSENK